MEFNFPEEEKENAQSFSILDLLSLRKLIIELHQLGVKVDATELGHVVTSLCLERVMYAGQ